MGDIPEFQRKQYAFAAHIRDPEKNAPPDGVEDRRMAIYRELFFNNLHSLLSSTFPVLTKLHTDEQWRALVREFMVRHEAQTPYFLEIPKEFLLFLEHDHEEQPDDFPFLLELAHYEWVELALAVSEERDDMTGIDADGDLLGGIPVKSVLAWVLAYRFPVHQISEDFQPQAPGDEPTCLAIFRKADDELGFMKLSPVTARLLDVIENNGRGHPGRELLLALAEELDYPDAEAFVAHGGDALEEMRRNGILLGVTEKT